MSRAAGDELSPVADRRADTPAPSAPGRLSDRLDRLPPGHPSSPYEADGTRRDPAPRLRDYDTHEDEAPEADADDVCPQAGADNVRSADGVRPFTDGEWAEHRDEVDHILTESRAAELASDYRHTIDPDRRSWTEDRSSRHKEIIGEMYARAADVPNQYQALLAGGLAGAGKTTVLKEVAEIDRSNYLTINPDDIKEELAKRGLIPKIDGLSPMEASDLVHEESSYIALQLAMRAQADGKNVIWDITMSSSAKVEDRITNLRAAGYEKVDGIFVDIPLDVSARRVDARHREGEEDYRSGKGLGGRYVPSDIILSQSDETWSSRNRGTFEALKSRFDQWSLYDNSVDGRRAILVEDGSRDETQEERTS